MNGKRAFLLHGDMSPVPGGVFPNSILEIAMAYSPSGERPIIAAWPFASLTSLLRSAARYAKVRRNRIALTTLIEMDEYRLWDLGISRNDLARALQSDDFDIDAIRDQRRGFDVWPPR
jgi:uncharacterized protein YjiS (DUF1127 family)